jgi:hypothetical protein
MVDSGDAPVISSDDEVVDERRRDEWKATTWSTQMLQTRVTFGLGWDGKFAAN